jgi:HEAT repeat protein
LISLLDDPDAQKRARAACTLARMGPYASAASPALLRSMQDADPHVRWHVVYALGRIGKATPEIIDVLNKEMNDDRSPLPAFAAAMLRRLAPQMNMTPRLLELLDHADADTRERTIKELTAIGARGDQEKASVAVALPRLTGLLADTDKRVSMAAMSAVFHLASPEAAHAALADVVQAPPRDAEEWRHAARLWGALDQQITSAARGP